MLPMKSTNTRNDHINNSQHKVIFGRYAQLYLGDNVSMSRVLNIEK